MKPVGFTTLGHSDRSLETVEAMLGEAGVDLVADVRAFPRSRSNPAFNIDSFPERLKAVGIDYVHLGALGGRRPRQPDVPPQTNALWRVQAFHNYADYALGESYGSGFGTLRDLGDGHRVAIMCAEAVWWRCHRRIIADYLMLNGRPVEHLMDLGQTTEGTPTPGAVRRPDGKVVYPASKAEDQPLGS